MAVALLLAFPVAAQQSEIIRTVVIDAGHGGKDAGAVYARGKYLEKDIVLAVALKLGRIIGENYPQVKVVYTRTTDVFVALDERGKIANNANADLFFSIHTNSNEGRPGTGTETYVMGLTKSSQSLATVMRENDVISMEADYSTRYMGYEPGSSESLIIFNLMQFAYREQSLALARCVQESYRRHFTLIDRGVKEGPYLVLWSPAMPSVLTEIGFINNPNDHKEFISDQGQERYALALFNAFKEYKTRTESGGGMAAQPHITPQTAPATRPAAPTTAPAAQQTQTQSRAATQTQPQATAQRQPDPRAGFPAAAAAAANKPHIVFSVQVRASSRQLSLTDPGFGYYRGRVFEKHIPPYYKYFVGECTTYAEASHLQTEVMRGLGECFVVAFKDGQPISVSEANKLLK